MRHHLISVPYRGRNVLQSARRLAGIALLHFCCSLVLIVAPSRADTRSAAAIALPMNPNSWSEAPPMAWVGDAPAAITFARYEGMPSGAMTVNEAVAVSKNAHFSNGTIEFDMKPLAYSDTGIIFRRQDNASGEFVYARANPDCPAADDCMQYAPIVHGRMDWDIYADFQGQAPIAPNGWNHFRLVVAGEKMLVYVNRQSEPSLVVPRLQGLATDGGIAFKGPAIYANLLLRPGAADALPNLHAPSAEPGTITTWLSAAPAAFPIDRSVSATDIPPANAWAKLQAEPSGLVNLSRAFGSPEAPAPAIGWLKTIIDAASPLRRTLRVGWARQVTVFLNGEAIFAGDNPYYPQEHRLSPNGRLEADNASVPLSLRQGRNEIVLAVGDRWMTSKGIAKLSPYGWAAEAHLDNLTGIKLEH